MGITDATQPDAAQTQPAADQDRTAGTQDAPVGLTQAQLDAIIANEKADVRRRIQREYGDLDELKAAKQALDDKRAAEMTETQRLQQMIEDMKAQQVQLQQEAETARLAALRLRVGQEVGLPPLLAERLHGADEDALKIDAQTILKTLGAQVRIPNINPTAGGGQSGSGKSLPPLSPGEVAAARAAGMSEEQYAKLKAELEGDR